MKTSMRQFHRRVFPYCRCIPMKPTSFRTITVLGLASGLFLGLGGSPSSMAVAEQAPEQVALTAPPLVQDAPAGNAVPPARTGDPAAGHGLNEFLSGLLDAIREKDSEAVSARIDTDGMFAEIQRQQIASVPTPGEKRGDRPKVQGPSLTLVRSSRLVPGFRLRMGLGLVDRHCDEAIRLDPKLAMAYNNRGFDDSKEGDLDHVIADCDEAIRLDPKLAWAYHKRGLAYNKKGDLSRAIADYDEAIRLNPKYDIAYLNRGLAYGKKGDLSRAIADYDAAIRVDPKYAVAYFNRGLAYGKKGDLSRAITDYDEAIRVDPKYAVAYFNRGLAYDKKGDRGRAIADYDAAIRIAPKYAVAYNNRGNAYSNKGDRDRAITDYDAAILLAPKYALAYFSRGTRLRQQGRPGPRHRRLRRGHSPRPETRQHTCPEARQCLPQPGPRLRQQGRPGPRHRRLRRGHSPRPQ